MRIVIVGAGAMGSLVGGLLAESGTEVILYDVMREQIAAIRQNGLIIEHRGIRRTIKVPATTEVATLGSADLLVVLVKAYDTRNAIYGVRSCITQSTLVLTLQNGLGNIEAIMETVPAHQILAGVTSHGSMSLGPGVIRHNGGAKTVIGPLASGSETEAEKVGRMLTEAGIETVVSADIMGTLWTKLVVNAAINPLTAITGCYNGELLADQDLRQIMKVIVGEALQVAKAQQVKLQSNNMPEYVESICLATSKNKSSMLMDILKGRRTEIDAINGMVVSQARKLNISTPANECVVRLVRFLEKRGGTGEV